MPSALECKLYRYALTAAILGVGLAAAVLLFGNPKWHPFIGDFQRFAYGPGPGLCYEDVWFDNIALRRDGVGNIIQKDNTTRKATWQWTYDPSGRVIKEYDPAGVNRLWVYGASGQWIRYEDSRLNRIQVEYGPDGKAQTLTFEDTGIRIPASEMALEIIAPPTFDAKGRRSPPLPRDWLGRLSVLRK